MYSMEKQADKTLFQAEDTALWETTRWNAGELQAAQAAEERRRGAPPTRARKPSPTVSEVVRQRRARIDQRRAVGSFFLKAIVIVALGYALLNYVFGFAAMNGESMYPRVRDGDLLIFYRLPDTLSIGDVVTFTRDGTRYVGRIVAKGGDKVEITSEGRLLINDNAQTEEIFYATQPHENDPAYPLQISEQSLFLLCDMRTNAVDSRDYGEVRLDELDGKVITVLRRRGI